MKPSKKKPAKRAVRRNSIEHKLMQLYNRIDVKQTSRMKHIDRKWVERQLEDVQAGIVFDKELMKRCNDMWRKYETR